MKTFLNWRWGGIAALIWFVCGFVAETFEVEPYLRRPDGLYFLIGLLLSWVAPVLLLAISGIRRGTVANKICGMLAIIISTWMLLPTLSMSGT